MENGCIGHCTVHCFFRFLSFSSATYTFSTVSSVRDDFSRTRHTCIHAIFCTCVENKVNFGSWCDYDENVHAQNFIQGSAQACKILLYRVYHDDDDEETKATTAMVQKREEILFFVIMEKLSRNSKYQALPPVTFVIKFTPEKPQCVWTMLKFRWMVPNLAIKEKGYLFLPVHIRRVYTFFRRHIIPMSLL